MFGKRRNPLTQETFPAGTYYIGDPCYAFPNEGPKEVLWDSVCDAVFAGGDTRSTQFFEIEGHRIAMDGTAYGDGCYQGSDGKDYAVDAGMLGILPIALVEFLGEPKTELERLGSIVTFDKDFTVKFDNGQFYFGHLFVDTCGTEDEEEEDDYTFAEDEDEDE